MQNSIHSRQKANKIIRRRSTYKRKGSFLIFFGIIFVAVAMKIEGAVALITGGAMGIGRAMAETLLQNGAKFVSVLDLNESAGSATEEDLNKSFGADKVKFFKCDVTSKDQLHDAFQKTLEVHNRLDIVCNNAGIEEQPDTEKIIRVNLLGTINGTNLARDIMMKQTDPAGGLIINTASMGGLLPTFYAPSYSASKYGIVGYTRSLAAHPLIRKANIRLTLLCPSFVDTSMVTRAKDGDPILQAVMMRANVLPMSTVIEAFLKAVTDDSLNGAAIRVTPGRGVDLNTFESPEEVAELEIVKP